MTPERHRHDLVRLSAAGWHAVLARPWDAPAQHCLSHWSAHDLPLVVTRQAEPNKESASTDGIALGLPAPMRWERRRIALHVSAAHVRDADGFPDMPAVTPLLSPRLAALWERLWQTLTAQGIVPQVYGSHGWQRLTGQTYLHPDSDLDLLLRVANAAAADWASAVLAGCGIAQPRLDGELLFPDGSAVAWREWPRWRRDMASGILVKRRSGALLVQADAWLAAASRVEARAP